MQYLCAILLCRINGWNCNAKDNPGTVADCDTKVYIGTRATSDTKATSGTNI